jgi:hypothetical protein
VSTHRVIYHRTISSRFFSFFFFFSFYTYTCRHKHSVYLSFIARLQTRLPKFLDKDRVVHRRACFKREKSEKKDEANSLRTFLRLDSDLTGILQHGHTVVSFRQRVESTHHCIYSRNVDFMFASTKNLVFSKQAGRPTALEASFLLPTLLCFLLFFFFFVIVVFSFLLGFFSFAFLHFSRRLSLSLSPLYYEHTTNASLGIDASLRRLMLLFFDDGDDSSGNIVCCRIC